MVPPRAGRHLFESYVTGYAYGNTFDLSWGYSRRGADGA